MFTLGQRVIITADSFEQSLPIGEHAYLIGRDRNPDSAFDWLIRVPKYDRHFPVTDKDISLEESIWEEAAERAQQEALLDFALATKNEALFRRVVGLADEEPEQGATKESPEEFIRKVNMKAWI
ncbi:MULTISPECIES: hypothetical protein [Brevibacillus]|uniref:hypothetical protein n=1 Tax=Brevibacillus TaxID=55080 RepID=UPI00036E1D0F|nr:MULTISPECIES: hypothetical protein [Brevibacillus]ATO50818.1 ATPase [Brevibacillus laterosporus DSM 25]AYB38972.1 ATPase [Brevibacillus laterosporus]MBG9774427.1 ATPase [Brevibacillus laterosporus]MBG9787206.1 ATPase [Brevibacillus laterosporus]MBG9797929.1 ATPase [Brevibacillus laterosporus]